MPVRKPPSRQGTYDIYPTHDIGEDKIHSGFGSLAKRLSNHPTIIIDGYIGVFFKDIIQKLEAEFQNLGTKANWIEVSSYLKDESDINKMIAPFLGGNDPLFGTRTTLDLSDFYKSKELSELEPDPGFDLNIIYGPGAALAGWNGLLVYIDLPKNELQYKARAGSVSNLGASAPSDHKSMYKRFYFVDWIVLNRHKAELVRQIDLIIDGQQVEDAVWMEGEELRTALGVLSHNCIRARPWFEPGAWGGQWIKGHINGLNKEEINYAWSFELIVPENGILLESSRKMLEVSFDFLMYHNAKAIMGEHYARYGTEFPIRFDFLDTFDGGNLSIQCHPMPDYIKEHFGENFTQEECYYILDAVEDARCNLGLKHDTDPEEFRKALETSFRDNTPVDIGKFVKNHLSRKHDLFLIPPGTIHGSGKNNLVLEISTTPYIFTFKMYDWLRPDLDGKPRPLNIARGMANLDFTRQRDRGTGRKGGLGIREIIAAPKLIDKGADWELFDLSTHPRHSYSVRRYHFNREIVVETNNKCHVLNLVEGTSILVLTAGGALHRFNYAETFVIPAAAGSYKVLNESAGPAILVQAFMK